MGFQSRSRGEEERRGVLVLLVVRFFLFLPSFFWVFGWFEGFERGEGGQFI